MDKKVGQTKLPLFLRKRKQKRPRVTVLRQVIKNVHKNISLAIHKTWIISVFFNIIGKSSLLPPFFWLRINLFCLHENRMRSIHVARNTPNINWLYESNQFYAIKNWIIPQNQQYCRSNRSTKLVGLSLLFVHRDQRVSRIDLPIPRIVELDS